ncbi:hypothetical protein [Nonomuraea sp. NPDC050310]|uniref:hypothetical protein n=1 Tax=Nonomuraea sp. NPDC050310 TaxID=3154935 RepID=UPI0033E8079E
MPTTDPDLQSVQLIGRRYPMPVEQAAELFGWPVEELRALHGDHVTVVQDLFNVSIVPPASSPEEI